MVLSVGQRVSVTSNAPSRHRPGETATITRAHPASHSPISWEDKQGEMPDPTLKLFEVQFEDGEIQNIPEQYLEPL